MFCEPSPIQEDNIKSFLYPNPIAGNATIEFSVKNSGVVKVELYGPTGEFLKTLFDQDVRNGPIYKVDFNVMNLNKGFYHYKVLMNNEVHGKPFIVTH